MTSYSMLASRRHFIRAMLLSSLAMILTVGAGIGATLAYFVTRTPVTSHVKAGSLSLDLQYTHVYGSVAEGSHLIAKTKEQGKLDPAISLTQTPDYVFEVEPAMPGLESKHVFLLTNTGIVDCKWSVGLNKLTYSTLDAEGEPEQYAADHALAAALDVTIRVPNEAGNGFENIFVGKATDIPTENTYDTIFALPSRFDRAPGESFEFEVVLALDYETVGNEISGGDIRFDLFVEGRSKDVE